MVNPPDALDLAVHAPKNERGLNRNCRRAAMRVIACLVLLLATAATQAAPEAARRTIVSDPGALARLRRNAGITLQWISWDYRGRVRVSEAAGLVHLSGSQTARSGAGRLELDGDVVEIGGGSFTFRGHIGITDTPDPGRACMRDGDFEFRITGRRRYWRLQQMEQCDGLTDYVDIYF
jgi:hypothetical protein